MKTVLVIIPLLVLYASCKSITMNIAVPDRFAANATQLKVSGLNGWKKRPKLTFGNYQTSKVKAGWVSTSGSSERLQKLFNMSRNNFAQNKRNKYQYTIQDGNLMAEVYCIEKTVKEGLTRETPLGDYTRIKNYVYSFSAVILPQTIQDEPWRLAFHNSYNSRNDTARKFWDRPYIEQEGYVTNGKIRINIRPIITDKVMGADGKELKTLTRLLMAYELNIDGGVIGIIDVFKNNVWIYNDLDNDMKLIIASVSSALLMRKLPEG